MPSVAERLVQLRLAISEWELDTEEVVSRLDDAIAELEEVAKVFRASGETHSECGDTTYAQFWRGIANRLAPEKEAHDAAE